MYKILITPRTFGKEDPSPIEYLKENGCEIILNTYGRTLTEEEMKELIRDVDGVIVGIDPLNANVLKEAKRLKVISKYGVGVDNIDLSFATNKGIIVTNTPETNSNAVAELTFGLIFDVARKISLCYKDVKEGKWGRYVGVEIRGKNMGIIGTGNIGRLVAEYAKGFKMNVLCYDINPDYSWANFLGVKYVSFERVLQESDIISLHLPLTEKTYHLISEKEISLMKPSSILINTSRGGIIDETALYLALKNNRILGAGLDVLEEEPPKESPLLNLDNVVITSHIGAHTKEAIEKMGRTSAENLILALKGEIPKYIVNKEVLKGGKS